MSFGVEGGVGIGKGEGKGRDEGVGWDAIRLSRL